MIGGGRNPTEKRGPKRSGFGGLRGRSGSPESGLTDLFRHFRKGT